jgi:hypothetical protein
MFLLSACGGGGTPTTSMNPSDKDSVDLTIKGTDNLEIPNNREQSEYQILILGNSHVAGVGSLLTQIFDNDNVNKSVSIRTRTGTFLDTIVNDASILELFQNTKWTHVILQGQKYSQSQSVLYPTDATITWIQRAKAIGATPILFPEHPLVNRPQDAEYVQSIHKGIAAEQSSCVAPVGLTWNQVLSISPDLNVHQADGNHATELGALLSSLVLYETISGEPADLLPFIDALPADSATQALFGQVTSQTIADNLPCGF